jgi:hypothetical protein
MTLEHHCSGALILGFAHSSNRLTLQIPYYPLSTLPWTTTSSSTPTVTLTTIAPELAAIINACMRIEVNSGRRHPRLQGPPLQTLTP